ncbi:hypothetical protein Vretimale_14181 [Volvox reticuliferus]|uniref:Kinesin light chain n=1 Tax=Volvox reticuliferus TaxID=1737510 RepID=A0A8J4CRB4_9CHLO|nr:hypothetical protein Vretifemale_15205 [Volvox reticuliferus]GIM10582.1 hypothetical protein Vretimale_14181 [Volvox reticuliferus]
MSDIGTKEETKEFRGVSLRFLSDFAAKVPTDLTTAEIVAQFIAPQCRTTHPQPFLDLISPKYVGPAQHYIIHAWSCCFLSDLVVPLLQHFIGDPNSDPVKRANALASTFVWIDCFSNPVQHSEEGEAPGAAATTANADVIDATTSGGSGGSSAGPSSTKGATDLCRRLQDLANRRGAVAGALQQCSSAVLLLDSAAAALSRTWCLYELVQALTLRGPKFLHVPVFDFTLDIVYSTLRSVNLPASEAHSPFDRRELLSALALQFKEEAEAADSASGGNPLRRSARLSGALGVATRRIISGIEDALVSEAQQLIQAGVRSGPRYLSCLRKAAEALRLGKAPLAEALALAAVKEHVKALGHSDVKTLTSLSNLALLRKGQGRAAEAEELLRKVLAGRQSALGRDHPDTAASCDQLAWLLQDTGNLEEAAALYREALDISRRALGEDHPDTASSCNNLAGVLQSLGRLDEAEPLLKTSLDVTKRTLGERHPHTATNYNNLGVLYRSRGDVRAARENFEAAYHITVAVLGVEHADTATATSNLALAMMAEGRLKEAEELLRQGLEDSEVYLGRSHDSVRQMLAALASVLKEQGRTEEAEEVFQLALPEPLPYPRSRPSESAEAQQVTAVAGAAAAEVVEAATAAGGAEAMEHLSPPPPLPAGPDNEANNPTEPVPPQSPPLPVVASSREPRRCIVVPVYIPAPRGMQSPGTAREAQEQEPLSPGGLVGEWIPGGGDGGGGPSQLLSSPPPSPPPAQRQEGDRLSDGPGATTSEHDAAGHAAVTAAPPPPPQPGESIMQTESELSRRKQKQQEGQQKPAEASGGDDSGNGNIRHSEQQRAEAAVRIQAYHRGCLARRKVADMRRKATRPATPSPVEPGVVAAMAGLAAAAAALPPLALPNSPTSPLPRTGGDAAPTLTPSSLSLAPTPTVPSLPPTPPSANSALSRRPPSRNVAIVNAREALKRSCGGGGGTALSPPPPPPLLMSYSGRTAAVVAKAGSDASLVSHPLSPSDPSPQCAGTVHDFFRSIDAAAVRSAAGPVAATAAHGGGSQILSNVSSYNNNTNGLRGAISLPPSLSMRSAHLSDSQGSLESGLPPSPMPMPLSGALGLLPPPWVGAAAAAVPAATPRVDDLMDLHADMLGSALGQLRLMKARDKVVKSSLDSRASLQMKLEFIRLAVEQAVEAIGNPQALLTSPKPPPPPPLQQYGSSGAVPVSQVIRRTASALLPSATSETKLRSSCIGSDGDAGGRGANSCGSSDSGKETSLAMLHPSVGNGGGLRRTSRSSSGNGDGGSGAQHAAPHGPEVRAPVPPSPPSSLTSSGRHLESLLSAPAATPGAVPLRGSVREGDVQALMAELTDLRALLFTTSSALSAAQRGLNQERASRKVMSAEIEELQRRLSAAMGGSSGAPMGPQQLTSGSKTATATMAARPPSARTAGTALSPTAPVPGPFAAMVNPGSSNGSSGGGPRTSGGRVSGAVRPISAWKRHTTEREQVGATAALPTKT